LFQGHKAKKDNSMLNHMVSFIYNPDAKRLGHLLNSNNFSLIREGGHFQNFIDSQYLSKENQKALTPVGPYDIK